MLVPNIMSGESLNGVSKLWEKGKTLLLMAGTKGHYIVNVQIQQADCKN